MYANILFGFQIIVAWLLIIPQTLHILSGKTRGLSLAMFVIFLAYLALSLALAINSYKEKKEQNRKYLIIVLGQWFILISAMLILSIGRTTWSEKDSFFCVSVLIISVITVMAFKGIGNPYCKGLLSIWCKGLSQLWLVYSMISAGSSEGIPAMTIFAGHASNWPRLIQVIAAGKNGGWDRSTKGLLMGELGNVITWTTVTITWTILRVL